MNNDQAFPMPAAFNQHSGDPLNFAEYGLTKRELFAAMAMQGIVSNPEEMQLVVEVAKKRKMVRSDIIAKQAVFQAECLLEALSDD